jgi:16S rRNA (guanine966-N2)-methyltransferase
VRVAGGILRGRRLTAPRSRTRPTQDRVRQALFNMLGERLVGARFLDLFAGSGAVGIEAWSRGAQTVVWVESERTVLNCLRENVGLLCAEAGRVVSGRVEQVLKNPKKRLANGKFDIIFADPPYGRHGWQARLGALLRAGDWLAPQGLWVMEAGADASSCEPAPVGWRLGDERRYGDAVLRFWSRGDGDAGSSFRIADEENGAV